jgi:predicted tellurium resistance membrane protein TerC
MGAVALIAELQAAFSGPEALVQLLTLVFLEIILGIDNIVFISLTSDRLPPEQQHIGRRLGLAAAMCTRIALLFTLGWIMHLTKPLFSIPLGPFTLDVTGKNIILLCGGVYLIYKGVTELRDMLRLVEERAALEHPDAGPKKTLTLPRAVATIAVMDIVFSLDSVITAVGLVDHVIIAAFAIVIAILFMMAFADVVSDFINHNPEVKVLALFFILTIGVLLVVEFFGVEVNQWYIYVSMFFTLLVTVLQMVYKRRLGSKLERDASSVARPGAVAQFVRRSPEYVIQLATCLVGVAVMGVVALCGVDVDFVFALAAFLFSLVVTVLQRRYSINLLRMHEELAAIGKAPADDGDAPRQGAQGEGAASSPREG